VAWHLHAEQPLHVDLGRDREQRVVAVDDRRPRRRWCNRLWRIGQAADDVVDDEAPVDVETQSVYAGRRVVLPRQGARDPEDFPCGGGMRRFVGVGLRAM
jgi:hypothetical protein